MSESNGMEQGDGRAKAGAAPEPSLAELAAKAHASRTGQSAASAPPLDEDEGMPALAGRRKSNRMLTVLLVVAVVIVGAALVVMANHERPRSKRKDMNTAPETVSNNLPPLILPSAPPPPPVAAGPAPAASAAPIVLRSAPAGAGRAVPGQAQAKKPLEWTDRKMGGSMVVSTSGTATGGTDPKPTVPGKAPEASPLQGGLDALGAPPASKNELVARLQPAELKGASAALLPDRRYLIAKGATLDCVLETAIDTTLPGITTCILTSDVYSDNSEVLLLEKGTQLVGEQQGNVKQGQARVFALWSRAKTPKGVIINLVSPGTDALGRSGLAGWVDNHFAERFGSAILMSFIQSAVRNVGDSGRSSGGTTVYGNAADSGGRVIEKILDTTVNIPPTIIINQGEHVQVKVARDLDFSAVYGLKVAE